MATPDYRLVSELVLRGLSREPRYTGRTDMPIGWASTRGLVRDENQDRLVVARCSDGTSIAIVADGMGGMREGARAAAIAASTAVSFCVCEPKSNLRQMLEQALFVANDAIYRELRGSGGAAVVLAAWTASERWIAHVGDARAYRVEHDGSLHQLTTDDTVGAQLAQLGRTTAKEGELHSQLLQYIGMGKELEPHISKLSESGRGILIMSDGIHSLPMHVMEWIARNGHVQLVAERLVEASKWNGGRDNGSVIAVSLQSSSPSQSEHAGLAEVWMPGEHFVFVQPAVRHGHQASLDMTHESSETITIETLPPGPKKQRNRRRNKDKEDVDKIHFLFERKMPIVNFGTGNESDPLIAKDESLHPTPDDESVPLTMSEESVPQETYEKSSVLLEPEGVPPRADDRESSDAGSDKK